MRTLSLFCFAIVLICSSSIAAESARDEDFATGRYRLDGYWLLSGKWMGHMGLALKIDKNRFQYWFYSDFRIGNAPTYPISGDIEIKKNTVHLKCSAGEDLYSQDWHLVIYRNQICLLAEEHYQEYMKTDKLDDSRLLYKIAESDIRDKKTPQMNAFVRLRTRELLSMSGGLESKRAAGNEPAKAADGTKQRSPAPMPEPAGKVVELTIRVIEYRGDMMHSSAIGERGAIYHPDAFDAAVCEILSPAAYAGQKLQIWGWNRKERVDPKLRQKGNVVRVQCDLQKRVTPPWTSGPTGFGQWEVRLSKAPASAN
jgi:hypothetical protein